MALTATPGSDTRKRESFCEDVQTTPKLRADRENCVVPGVKIVGIISKNDGGTRRYLPEALKAALPMYEGASVRVDHVPRGASRPFGNRNGTLRNVRVTEDGLFGDHHYNPKHPSSEPYLWDVEHETPGVGFSHDIDALVERKNGESVVAEICLVRSVDMVDRAATTKSFTESEDDIPPEQQDFCEHGLSACSDLHSILTGSEPMASKQARLTAVLEQWRAELIPTSAKKESNVEYKDLTLKGLQENCPDLVAQMTGTDKVSTLTAEKQSLTESLTAKDTEIGTLKAKMTVMEAEKAEAVHAATIQEELKASKVVDPPRALVIALKGASDAAVRKSLIEEHTVWIKKHIGRTPEAAPFATVDPPETENLKQRKTCQESMDGWRS